MRCLKCGHEFSDKITTCMYCGASLGRQDSSKINVVVHEARHISLTDNQNKKVELDDLPENIRQKIEAAIQEGKGVEVVEEKSDVVETTAASSSGERGQISMEKLLALLSKLKASLDCGKLENGVYERMTAGFIKDYIAALPAEVRFNFVVNEIQDSDLAEYIHAEMLIDLRALVLSSISAEK